MATKVVMPQLGESVVEGTVTKWLRQEGETVQEFDALLEVNTDKVDTEIPSPASGTLLKILVAEGTTVNAGTVLAYIGQPGEEIAGEGGPAAVKGEGAQARPVPAGAEGVPPEAVAADAAAEKVVPGAGRDRDLGFISPVVARLARENNVDLYQVQGTGEGGRITKKDVLAYIQQGGKPARPEPAATAVQEAAEPAAWETPGEGDLFRPTELMFAQGAPQAGKKAEVKPPAAKPEQAGAAAVQPGQGDRVIPHSTMRKNIAEHMVFSKRTAPHVTTVMEANLQKVTAHRAANKEEFAGRGVNLTYTAYFISAAVQALRAFPLVNSSWSDEGVIVHNAVNFGMATSLGDEGLIVPVIKNADNLSLFGLAQAINDLASRARSRRLQPDEVKGGTFTITNHGISGSLFATPVINQPQCAILGVGAVQKRVVVIDDAIAIRPMVYLSLTFDHRILDGALADGFLHRVVDVLENWI